MDNKTGIVMSKFHGHDVFEIWKVDSEGNTIGDKPIVSFGSIKAEAIVKHIEDIQQFVETKKAEKAEKAVPKPKIKPKKAVAIKE